MVVLARLSRRRTIPFLIASLATASWITTAADDLTAAQAIISEAQAKYETYSADVEMTMGSGDTSVKSAGNVRGKAALYASRMSVDHSGYKQEYLTVKDQTGFVWEEQQEDGEKSVTKSRHDNDAGGFPLADAMALLDRLMTGPGNLKEVLASYGQQYELTSVKEETIGGESVLVFEGPLKENVRQPIQLIVEADAADNDKGPTAETMAIVFRLASDLTTIRIAIAKSDGLPRVIEATRSDGTPSMKQAFTNVVINAASEESAFVYTPPPGERVIELR